MDKGYSHNENCCQDAVSYHNLGLTYYNLREKEKALENLNRAIILNPKYAYAYGSRGTVYKDKGEKEKALVDLRKAADLFLQQNNTAYREQILEIIKQLVE